MSDIVDTLKSWDRCYPGNIDIESAIDESADEIERLQKYEKLVWFIANDYYEMSYDKAKWQRDDWWKRCRKLIEEDV